MLRIHETDRNGVTHSWVVRMGDCPECGSLCAFDLPCTPLTPRRVLCCSCSYSEGYSYSPGHG
ncbi:hypothetical protein [Geobacter sp. DSM 9736]|uniref:hypothetical protein n=1 Tax=Geobacter sp. DSM 9736 TaxID=1277350 RepID=UPI000B5FCEEC|nr:hypothetical protein [Geobacter sp. DSM 9736]SNB47864.1 hypothetical protein SAMN06269301_3358 [Geobacter sp. DSM 9736]